MSGICGHGCIYFKSGLDEPKICTGGNQARLDNYWLINGSKTLDEATPISCYSPYEIEIVLKDAVAKTNKLLNSLSQQ